MEKFLYFRNVAAVADDQAIENSACFPYSALLGIHPVSDTSVRLTFANIQRPAGGNAAAAADSAANLPLVDTVVLNITANKGREVMRAIVGAANGTNSDGMLVIADDAADSVGGATTLVPEITSCGTIVHNAAFTNS